MKNNMLWLTLTADECPVAVYATEDAAKAAVEKSEIAAQKLRQLKEELVGEMPSELNCSSYEHDEFIYLDQQGIYHESREMAEWHDRLWRFDHSDDEEIAKLRRQSGQVAYTTVSNCLVNSDPDL